MRPETVEGPDTDSDEDFGEEQPTIDRKYFVESKKEDKSEKKAKTNIILDVSNDKPIEIYVDQPTERKMEPSTAGDFKNVKIRSLTTYNPIPKANWKERENHKYIMPVKKREIVDIDSEKRLIGFGKLGDEPLTEAEKQQPYPKMDTEVVETYRKETVISEILESGELSFDRPVTPLE